MGRKSREKRERRVLRTAFERTGLSVVTDLAGRQEVSRRKMSAVLAEFVAPQVEEDMSLESYKVLVALGALVWNLEVEDEPAEPVLADLTENYDKEGARILRTLFAELRERKQRLFSQDERFIVKWNTTREPDGGFYLEVASTWRE